ncbi:hypothetical protein [Flavobacterium sp. 3HN19-14]|uniref:hypothetical protein n=1 Tax=Flavobacterium sp. 3HN19-14 TaxID=3448133 RepID=UPI003EE29803
MKYSYIIVDDDAASISKTAKVFAGFSNYFLLGTANTSDDAVNLVLEHKPKMIVLEIDPTKRTADCR